MELEIAAPGETGLAQAAAVRCIVCVDVHVEFQIGKLVKCFLAKIAVIWFLSCVDEDVIAQIAFLMETFATDVADEFFELAVRANVSLQGG